MNIWKQPILFPKNITTKFKTIYNSYGRWATRKSHKVLSVDEYEKQNNSQKVNRREIAKNKPADDETVDVNAADSEKKVKPMKPYRTRIKSYEQIQKPKKVSTDMLQVVFDENGEFIYTKMLDTDPRVGTLLTNIKSRKERNKQELILLEGKRLILDALECNCLLKYILFSRKSDLEYLKDKVPKSGACLYKMPYKEIQMWSDLTTTPGIMGIFRTPNIEHYKSKSPQLPITFVLDNIREPGNLGAILRVCAGVSCSRVLLTKGCAHVWEPKVTRGAMGAHFRLQLHSNVDYDQINDIICDNLKKDQHLRVIVADTTNVGEQNQILPIIPYYAHQFGLKDQIVVIIGGETEGISEESYRFAKSHDGISLNIPLSNNAESLNSSAALAIIAFDVKKQLTILQNV